VLAFTGVSRVFPADAALGLSARIIGKKNTAVNRILGQGTVAKRYILTNHDPETIQLFLASLPDQEIWVSQGLWSTAALGCVGGRPAIYGREKDCLLPRFRAGTTPS
jgi:hypothetical protein